MNKKIFWQIAKATIRNRKTIFLVLLLINISSLALYAALSPTLDKQAAELNKMLATMPEAFLKAFNVSAQINGGYEGLLVTKQFALLLPIFSLVIAINFAGTAIAGEINKGTILMYLTKPISRAQYFWSKYLTGLAMLLVFVILSVMPAVPFGWIFNLNVEITHYLIYTLSTFILSWALYSIAFFAASFSNEIGKVTLITAGVFFVSYLFSVLSQLVDQLVDLKYFSLLYYFGPETHLIDGAVFVFGIIITLATFGAYRVFCNRDIAVR